MDFVDTLNVVRYSLKVLLGMRPTSFGELEVKVTDLEFRIFMILQIYWSKVLLM